MDNDFGMNVNEGQGAKSKKKFILIAVIAIAVIFLVIIISSIMTSPKVLLGKLIENTPDELIAVMEADMGETPLFMTESHQSTTEFTMNADALGMEGEVKITASSAYQNDTGDLLTELEIGLGDLDAVTGGFYLSGGEMALISSMLSNKYVVDLEYEDDIQKDTTMEQRLDAVMLALMSSGNEEEFEELMQRVEDKMRDIGKICIKELPRSATTKGKDEVELFGEDQNLKYVEVVLDNDQYKDWVETVSEIMLEDEELEDLMIEVAEYLNDTLLFEDEFDIDEIDLEESFEQLLDDIDDFESEVALRIYRKGYTPIAYELIYEDDYEDFEGLTVFHVSGDEYQVTWGIDYDGEKMYYSFYDDPGNYRSVQYDMEGMEYDVTLEKVENGLYELDGTFDYDTMGKGSIEGEIEETKDETTFEITAEFDEEDSSAEIKGTIETEGSVTKIEADYDIMVEGETVLSMEVEAETEEVKKNKEYETQGTLTISDTMIEQSYEIEFNNTTIYGEQAEAKLPSWSEKDVTAKISDKEELMDLFDALGEDFEKAIGDIYGLIFYGGLF